ncbi:MAG: translesion error-prone DNA polymerase V autoproteolytic subunit [Owenweeksia sp.]
MKINEIIPIDGETGFPVPFFDMAVAAGEPSYVSHPFQSTININEELIRNKKSTFCVRVAGQSMIDAGIDDGDLLIVDRGLEPQNNNVVLAVINGDYTVKRLYKNGSELFLQPANKNYSPIKITPFMDFRLWGVVTGVIKKLV